MDEMARSKSFAGARKTKENDENSFERIMGSLAVFLLSYW
jgi:hypothetical protein